MINTAIPKGLEKFIQRDEEEIIVDWNGLGNLKKQVYFGKIDSETFDEALEYLLEKGVLTFKREGIWRIISLGSDFGPKTSYGQDRMNFSREKDSREYLEAFHKTAVYSIAVEKLD